MPEPEYLMEPPKGSFNLERFPRELLDRAVTARDKRSGSDTHESENQDSRKSNVDLAFEN